MSERQATSNEQFTVIVCPSEIGIGNVSELKDSLLAALRVSTRIAIDAGALLRIDTAGLQLFAALARELSRRQGVLRWDHISAALQTAARRLGLAGMMGLAASAEGGR